MSAFPNIKMRGNGQARNDVGVTTSPCWPNLDNFVVRQQHVGEMSATCTTKLMYKHCCSAALPGNMFRRWKVMQS